MTHRIILQCLISAAEHPVLREACRQLSTALTAVDATTSGIEYTTSAFPDQIAPSNTATLVITSMEDQVDSVDAQWPEIESRLRQRHAALAINENRIVYLCTVFRHVPVGDPDRTRRLRTRIRRLNLLAAELSRETGLYVIDIDRAFADVGAQALATDYQLSGPFAAAAAGRIIADTLLSTGFDAFESFEIQEAARAKLASEKILRAVPPVARAMNGATNTTTVRAGRRTQNAQVIGHKADRMGEYIRRVLTGRVPLRDAATTVSDVVARHGILHVFKVVGRQAGRAIRSRKAAL